MHERPAGWDLEVDVVAVGSGLGSIGAAIAAHDRGSRAVVLEKAPRLGGVCGYGGGEVFVPNNHKMRELGIADSDDAGRRYFAFLSAGFADPALQKKLLDTHAHRDRVLRARGRRALDRRRGPAGLLLPRRARLACGRPLPLGRALRRAPGSASGRARPIR